MSQDRWCSWYLALVQREAAKEEKCPPKCQTQGAPKHGKQVQGSSEVQSVRHKRIPKYGKPIRPFRGTVSSGYHWAAGLISGKNWNMDPMPVVALEVEASLIDVF